MVRGKGVISGLLFPLILAAVVYALLLPHPSPGGTRVQAEFGDAGLLVPDDQVRIAGTTVGSVQSMRLTDHGTALVTFNVAAGIAVHADATASVREEDLLGDVYLDLGPGHSTEPLREPIPATHTFLATGLQDLFDTFNAPTRTALQTLIVELGTALDARGADLNQAVERLAPAVGAVDRISVQLGSQNAQLQQLIDSARGLTAQLAPRSADISRLIDGLDATLRLTSARTAALASGVEQLPGTLGAARATLTKLTATANALTPLAKRLDAVASPLGGAVDAIGPFTADARSALDQADPLLSLAAQTLGGARQSLPLLAGAVDQLHAIAPPVAGLSTLIGPKVLAMGIKGVFAGLGGLAADPGPEGRNYFRGELVLGCETFGVPTRPGCLAQALQQAAGLPVGVAAGTLPSARRPRSGVPRSSVAKTPVASPAIRAPSLPTLPSPASILQPVLAPIAKAVGGPVGKLLNYLIGP